jgi:hypothetical protein
VQPVSSSCSFCGTRSQVLEASRFLYDSEVQIAPLLSLSLSLLGGWISVPFAPAPEQRCIAATFICCEARQYFAMKFYTLVSSAYVIGSRRPALMLMSTQRMRRPENNKKEDEMVERRFRGVASSNIYTFICCWRCVLWSEFAKFVVSFVSSVEG